MQNSDTEGNAMPRGDAAQRPATGDPLGEMPPGAGEVDQGSGLQHAAARAVEQIEEIRGRMSSGVRDATSRVRDAMHSPGDLFDDDSPAAQAGAHASERIGDARDRVSHGIKDAASTLRDDLRGARDRAAAGVERIEDAPKKLRDFARHEEQKSSRPNGIVVAVVLLAVALAAFIAWRRDRE